MEGLTYGPYISINHRYFVNATPLRLTIRFFKNFCRVIQQYMCCLNNCLLSSRILYGKMLSKTGKDSSGKAKSNYRRTIVFKFIIGCETSEICLFLDMVFSSFTSYTSGKSLYCGYIFFI